MEKTKLVIWKDETYKVCTPLDANQYENDENWFMTFDIKHLYEAENESRPLDALVMQKARLFTKAKIRLLGQKEAKILPITNITFRDEKVHSVTVEYPLGNNHYDYLTYYFDGRKIGECKDIDVNEIFEGFSV